MLHCHAELSLFHHFVAVGFGNLGIAVHTLHVCLQRRIIVLNLLGGKDYFREIGGHNRDTTGLEQLLRGAAGVEAERTRSNLSDARMLQTVHHTADGRKLVDVLCQQRVVNAVGVEGGVGEGNAILIEVVADGNLSAESITALVERHLVVLVVAGLYQNGYAEVGHRNSVDDANLETEIRQRHDDTVNLITVLTEEFGALQSILARLD